MKESTNAPFQKKRIILISLTVICFLVLAQTIHGVSVGVSPGRLNYANVLKGGYAERTSTITTSLTQNLTAHYEVYGDISTWISFQPPNQTFTFSRDNPYKLTVIVRPPNNTMNGDYTGQIRILTDHLGSLTDTSGSFVRAAVMMNLAVTVTGTEIVACRGGGVTIFDSEEGYPLEVMITVYNDGNVNIAPKLNIDIWDQKQETLLLSTAIPGTNVLPTTGNPLSYIITDQNLPVGQYWAYVSIPECAVSDLVTFDIVEKGLIADKGELISVSAKTWNYVGDNIPIQITFRNNGERNVRTQFKGTISVGDVVEEIVNTDLVEVEAHKTETLTYYFTPKKPGRYEVKGRVQYNNKITFEKGAIINVNPKPAVPSGVFKVQWWVILLYVIVILAILFFLKKILDLRREEH